MTLTCPTCDSDVSIVFERQCLDCTDAETRAIIERLQPEEGDSG